MCVLSKLTQELYKQGYFFPFHFTRFHPVSTLGLSRSRSYKVGKINYGLLKFWIFSLLLMRTPYIFYLPESLFSQMKRGLCGFWKSLGILKLAAFQMNLVKMVWCGEPKVLVDVQFCCLSFSTETCYGTEFFF